MTTGPLRESARQHGVFVIAAMALLATAAVVEPVRTALVGRGLWTPSPTGMPIDELFFGGMTAIGAGPGLLLLVSTIAIGLVATRRPTAATFIVVAVIAASLVTRIAKDLYRAPRPMTMDEAAFMPHPIPGALVVAVALLAVGIGVIRGWRYRSIGFGAIVLAVAFLERITDVVPVVHGFDSFPSGHAISSAALATAVILMTWGDRRWRWPVAAVAIGYTLMVGVSRLYLGVHYPVDVIAGWCVGVASTLLVWVVLRASTRWRRERLVSLASSLW